MRRPRSRPVPAGPALVGLLVATLGVAATCAPPEASPPATPTAPGTVVVRVTEPTPTLLWYWPTTSPSSAATYEAIRQARMPLPGESIEDYNQRLGIVTLCDKTRGQVVKNLDGREVQLAPDECVSGDIIAEPGRNGGGGRFLAIRKGATMRGHITRDGRVVAADLIIDHSGEEEMLTAERAAQQERETE